MPRDAAGVPLWLGAALVVLVAHGALGMLAMRAPPVMPADDTPPAAIMIDYSEVAEAVETSQNEITPDVTASEAVNPIQPVDATEVTPTDSAEQVEPQAAEQPSESNEVETTAAVPEAMPVEPEEVVQPEEEQLVLPDVDVPLPRARPQPPKTVQETARERPRERRPSPTRQRQQVPARQAVEAKAQVTQSDRNAARQTASGVMSTVSPARWQSRLMAHLERRKRYPSGARSRGEQGIAHVRFRIDESGNVLDVALVRSSGHAELDAEVISLVRRASPVPAPPPGVNRTITAPVRFNRR